MDLQLKGKTALVTGASQGLGFATASLLGQEGANVAINSRSTEKINTAASKINKLSTSPVLALTGDVTEPDIPIYLVDQTVKCFNGLDILICNSGGPPPGSFEDFNDTEWQKAFEMSLLSYVRLIRAALPYLKNSSAASVLTVTSISVKQPISNLILSNSIRSATIGLTKSLALELGNQGIRFNSILPAWTETDRVLNLLQRRAEVNGTDIEVEKQKQSAATSLGRMGTPLEFAQAAVFLVSPAASYITGVMLPVDGGLYKGTF